MSHGGAAVDCGELYEQARRSLVELVGTLPAEVLNRTVVATPAWSVHDVIAHLVGITADLNASSFGTDDPDAWTATQVDARRTASVGELCAEWDREAPTFEVGLRLFGYEIGSHYVGDLLQHSQDIRSAVGASRIPDDDAFGAALGFYLDYFALALAGNDLGSVDVRVDDHVRTVGTGPAIASVAATRFELFRALGGRRTEAQIRAFAWTGDSAGVAPLLAAYPMPTYPFVDA